MSGAGSQDCAKIALQLRNADKVYDTDTLRLRDLRNRPITKTPQRFQRHRDFSFKNFLQRCWASPGARQAVVGLFHSNRSSAPREALNLAWVLSVARQVKFFTISWEVRSWRTCGSWMGAFTAVFVDVARVLLGPHARVYAR